MNNEIWKVYAETHSNNQYYKSGIWEVSNLGNIRHNGELIDLSKYKHKKYIGISGFYIHHAVAKLFVPNPENKPEIDHINGNKHDNRAENLRWVTHKENMNNPIWHKRNKEAHKGQIAWNKGISGVSEETSCKMKAAWKHRLPDSEETRHRKSEAAKRNWAIRKLK